MKDVDDDDFLKTGFDDMEGDHIQAWAESKNNGWTANQAGLSPFALPLIGWVL